MSKWFFILYFIVGSTQLVATKFPKSAVKEGTTATFKCSSDEGNPPPLIRWNRGCGNDNTKPGRFHASTSESTLSIAVNRTLNHGKSICFIEENIETGQKQLEMEMSLSVICESFYFLI